MEVWLKTISRITLMPRCVLRSEALEVIQAADWGLTA